MTDEQQKCSEKCSKGISIVEQEKHSRVCWLTERKKKYSQGHNNYKRAKRTLVECGNCWRAKDAQRAQCSEQNVAPGIVYPTEKIRVMKSASVSREKRCSPTVD